MASEVRVRFAPSPTGFLHIGGLRNALYYSLDARSQGGTFMLRIEDTDRSRYGEEAEADIHRALVWSGLESDEGPQNPGDYGLFRQSERQELYQKYAQQLIDDGNAYYEFDTHEELDELRE